MVPFTSCPAEYEMNGTCERDKGATAAPLSIPEGNKPKAPRSGDFLCREPGLLRGRRQPP